MVVIVTAISVSAVWGQGCLKGAGHRKNLVGYVFDIKLA